MAGDDPRSGEVEFLDVGPPRGPGRATGWWRRWPWLLVAAVVVAGVILLLVRRADGPPGAHGSFRSVPASPSALAGSRGANRTATSAPVTVTRVGHRLLGGASGWELFGRGPGVLVRIEVGRGRITRTIVPALQSSGPVSFLAVAGEAIIRPIDDVPGYVVPDGRAVRPIPAALARIGPIFPGPDPNQLWVSSGGNHHAVMRLTDLDGSTTIATIRLPAGGSPLEATADSDGNLLIPTADGVYDATPGRTRRITTGTLLAAGPTGWLVKECGRQHHCRSVLINRSSGKRHVIGPAARGGAPYGAIAPDGRTAALFAVGPTGHITLELLNLRSHVTRTIHLHIDQAITDGTITWSPDSRWLFAINASGKLNLVSATTGRVSRLATKLPPLSQLAVRRDTSR